jgi:hypothetical protein
VRQLLLGGAWRRAGACGLWQHAGPWMRSRARCWTLSGVVLGDDGMLRMPISMTLQCQAEEHQALVGSILASRMAMRCIPA